jgi:FAM195 family
MDIVAMISNPFSINLQATSEPDLAEFYYRGTSDRVPGFKPFDLEEFWGRRTFLQLTQSRGNQ